MKTSLSAIVVAASLMLGSSTAVLAQERHEFRGHEREPERPHLAMHAERAPHLLLDQRYQHNHYYPGRGEVMATLPSGSISVGFGGGNWFFHGGVWFRPYGARFIVDLPPVGIFVPVLPPDVVTLWIGGMPYYYANGVYYAQASGSGYSVVAPPPGAQTAQAVPAAPAPRALPDPVFYPRNGQSAEQTEADRQACDRWATTQPSALADASVFQRSEAACMDGRGYTVR